MDNDLYCKVYLKSEADLSGLKALMSEILNAGFEGRTVCADHLQIDVFENRGAVLSSDESDRAVCWPYYLEIEPADTEVAQPERFVVSIATILKALRLNGVQAVPSCDFEDQLATMS